MKLFKNIKYIKLKCWERFLLKFKPYHIGVDYASGEDYTVKVYIRYLFGKCYVIKTKEEK